MRYEVKAVRDELLPLHQDWVFVVVDDGVFLFVKESLFADPAGLCAVLSSAWSAGVATDAEPTSKVAAHLRAVS